VYQPRKTWPLSNCFDPQQIKLYAISASGEPVDPQPFLARLAAVKAARALDWESLPAFAIFHHGARMLYLVLCWWGNDNELFHSVSVLTDLGWVEDPQRYSFCLYDLEVIWFERQTFIQHVYHSHPDLAAYRAARLNFSS
jgi:hypothetical protein